MTVTRLDHVNLRTAALAEMIAWYGEVLGLEPGPRPPFPFGGAWLYCGGQPVIHLVEVERKAAAEDPALEHFALAASGLDAFLDRLRARGIAFDCREVPGFGITQVNLWDPDGNHLHVDFTSGPAAGGAPG
ncbi:VOC family protein [Marinimicrococcus flavescens]|uniref:VOC family protein n=1 Tax=Marinimicrococcus flavescens TaxID=3031815 RepID=A0AAP3XS33_9PROT|nr:VOC family protein [Marinimicrococcus flavescens]